MDSPEPENLAQIAGLANWLAQSLRRELPRLEGGSAGPRMQELYDSVYLPVLISFAELAAPHVASEKAASENLPLFREPLHADLAAAQIQFVLEILDVIVLSLP